jgi:hypothetical protein
VTDANKKLRELRDFVEECHMESEQDAQRAHPKQIGMRLAWRMVRGEIDRLLAEPTDPFVADPTTVTLGLWRGPQEKP